MHFKHALSAAIGSRPRSRRSAPHAGAAVLPKILKKWLKPEDPLLEERSTTTVIMDRNPWTLTRYILCEQQKHVHAAGDLSLILSAVGTACKAISSAVRRAGLTGLYGVDGGTNATGDSVKKLDVLSDEIFCNSLRHTKRVALLVSEEQEHPIAVEGAEGAKYICAFDPLDGSSNIDCNVSVGSIFGITRRAAECVGRAATAAECLQPGTALICAGYCVYGSSTQLVLTFAGGEVNVFTLDPSIGEFILSAPALRIPAAPQRIYSVNEGNIASFQPYVQRFVAECKAGKPYSLRCASRAVGRRKIVFGLAPLTAPCTLPSFPADTGSMVADVHRTLLYGGIFIYPSTASAPEGKLRLLYECAPMAMLLENAGGAAVTGEGAARIMDLLPTDPHSRSPIILGCMRDVERIMSIKAELGK